jgi:hypothetical protein
MVADLTVLVSVDYFTPLPGVIFRSLWSLKADWRDMSKKICKWYEVCPIKIFCEQGKLGKEWIERYCWGENERCVRCQLEEPGEPHLDNLLPNGEVRKELK